MDNTPFKSYKVEERSYVAFVKREIHNLVKTVFDTQRVGEIDIVVSELTSNLIKYAGSGELLYRLVTEDENPLFELICLDNGPGIKNVSHSMKDGVSSRSSLGQGIGSVMRLSNFAQFYSLLDWGTICYARFGPSQNEKSFEVKPSLLIRSLSVCKPGEFVCGDGYAAKYDKRGIAILTGDGLGHGPHAKEAIDQAIRSFHETAETDPAVLIRKINEDVRKTRGLVTTLVLFDDETKQWKLCGVGNIGTRIYQGLEYKNYICNNGIVGLNIPTRLENSIIPAERYQQLIMCSDGIKTKWDLIRYPSILKYDPMLLAAAIYKDHARQTDDMTVLIAKVV